MSVRDAIELANLSNMHNAILGHNGLLDSLNPYNNASGNGTGGNGLVTVPPWVEPPPNYQPIDEQSLIAVPAAPSVDTEVVVVVIPVGSDGTINTYSCNYIGGGFVDGSGDLIWRITIDGQPIRNFSNIKTERGSPSQPRTIPGGIRVYSGQRVAVVVNHASNGALTENVSANLGGWTYPSKGK